MSNVKIDKSLPALDVHLLRDLVTWAAQDQAVIDYFAERFEGWGSWEQEHWAEEVRNGVCRTSYCIAGQAVVQKGYALKLERNSYRVEGGISYNADYCGPALMVGTDDKGKPIYEPDENDLRTIESVGIEVIGLAEEESCLFNGSNDLGIVVSLASYFARRRGLDLELPQGVMELDRRISDDEFELFCDTESFDEDEGDY